jgi:hypothetical protein
MLDINPELVHSIIQKAKQFQAKEEIDSPEQESDSPDNMDISVLTDQPDDLVYDEVKQAIQDLDPDQQAELVALIWLGREDYLVDEWKKAVKEARKIISPMTAEYILSKPQVSEYLEEGLSKLGYEVET